MLMINKWSLLVGSLFLMLSAGAAHAEPKFASAYASINNEGKVLCGTLRDNPQFVVCSSPFLGRRVVRDFRIDPKEANHAAREWAVYYCGRQLLAANALKPEPASLTLNQAYALCRGTSRRDTPYGEESFTDGKLTTPFNVYANPNTDALAESVEYYVFH